MRRDGESRIAFGAANGLCVYYVFSFLYFRMARMRRREFKNQAAL